VKTVLAWPVILMFITENIGVTVIGFGPLIIVAAIDVLYFFPRVLRSIAFELDWPPSAVGGIVGIIGVS